MVSKKKPARHGAGKAPAPASKTAKQKTTNAPNAAAKPRFPAAADALPPSRADTGALAVQGKHISEACAGLCTGTARTPVAKPEYKLVVLGPTAVGSAVAFDSPAVLDLLDLVRQRCSVQIDNGAPFPNSLTVCGTSPGSIRAAHQDICALLHSISAPGKKQVFAVHAPDDNHRQIVLAKSASNPGWSRFSFDEATSRNGDNDGADNRELLRAHAAIFRSQFADLVSTLQVAPCNLFTQVHLGSLLLFTNDHKPVGPGRSAAHLGNILAESTVKDCVVFDRRVGGRDAFDSFQQQLIRLGHDFYPCSSVAEKLSDVQPQKYLVIVTESFRVELEIGAPGSAPDGRSAKLSHLRVFQMLGSDSRVGMATSCPDHHADWKLEAVPELRPDEIPLTIKAFLGGVAVVYSPSSDFPVPVVRAGLIGAHRVRQMYGKTTWTVGCKGTQYLLELALYHKFPKPGVDGSNQVSTGVSISHGSWEELLKSPQTTGRSRDLGVDWSNLFRPRGRGDGVVDFLQLTQRILSVWDSVSDGMAGAGNNPPSDTPHQQDPPGIQRGQQIKLADKAPDAHEVPAPPCPEAPPTLFDSKLEEDLILFD